METLEFKLKTLTPIWTGGLNDRRREKCNAFHETSIIGSLRWWYEALVRGLGGFACDPSDKDNRCIYEKLNHNHCTVCDLFGCTGWSRKFKLKITNENGQLISKDIKNNQIINIELIPLKKINDAEKTFLTTVIKIISSYGSLGGKTTQKPSEISDKNKKSHHLDYGLIKLIKTQNKFQIKSEEDLKSYIKNFIVQDKMKHELKNDLSWPNLNYFWFIENNHIKRDEMNEIVKRDPNDPTNYLEPATEFHKYLGGKTGVSKKIFSFYSVNRAWGYSKAKVSEFDKVKKELKSNGFIIDKTGSEVINEVLNEL